MALNAYVTADGHEMGYAQAVQAWAAGIQPEAIMNPILLKPQGNMTSQVILKGQAVGTTTAADYYERYFDRGWQAITESLAELAKDYDFVVCEGAGSPAEINLKHRDLTNMRIAKYLDAPTLLVVDIDRGGAFAHVVGTLALLDEEERTLIQGIVINKFRGQLSILQPGIDWLENYTGIPVVGVIPWLEQAFPAEDSLDLIEPRGRKPDAEIEVAVIRLPHIANFTDFDPLEAEPTVRVKYINPGQPLGHPDAVLIPGSKTTIADLLTLRDRGTFTEIQNYAKAGGTLIGICGGMQILGQQISDPEGLEGIAGSYRGLDLLPLETVITPEKIVRQRETLSRFPYAEIPIQGYEIHQGRTHILSSSEPFQPLFEDTSLGLANETQTIWGCYLHGLFDNTQWRRQWLNRLRQQKNLPPLELMSESYRQQRETVLDELAKIVDKHLDLTPLLPQ